MSEYQVISAWFRVRQNIFHSNLFAQSISDFYGLDQLANIIASGIVPPLNI